MSLSLLPQELLDIIIDHLHDNKSSLWSCSLVAKPWLESSRHHLFHTIRLGSSSYQRGDSRDDILEFLESDYAVRTHVKEIIIDMRNIRGSNKGMEAISPQRSSSRNIVETVVQSLPSIRALALVHVGRHLPFLLEETSDSEPIDATGCPQPNLNKVYLQKLVVCDFITDCMELWKHLDNFSKIGELQLLNCEIVFSSQTDQAQVESTVAVPFPELDALVVDSKCGSDVWTGITGIIPSNRLSQLSSLSLFVEHAISLDSLRTLKHLITLAGPNLQSLRLDISDADIRSNETCTSLVNHVSLIPCTNLRDIQICIYAGSKYMFQDDDNFFQWKTLIDLFSPLTSQPTIQSIIISLHHVHQEPDAVNPKTIGSIPWDDLDKILGSFKGVETVMFQAETRMNEGEWKPSSESARSLNQDTQEVLQELFRTCSSTKRLRFL